MDISTIADVPVAFDPSNSEPRRVRLVVDALVIRKRVEEPVVVKKLVDVEFVVEALIATDEVAKKLVVVAFVVDELPIFTLPLDAIENHVAPDELATVKRSSVGCDEVPCIANLDETVVVPTPMFPVESISKNENPDEEATLNGFRLDVDVACTLNA